MNKIGNHRPKLGLCSQGLTLTLFSFALPDLETFILSNFPTFRLSDLKSFRPQDYPIIVAYKNLVYLPARFYALFLKFNVINKNLRNIIL
jgi:hypothetical protein